MPIIALHNARFMMQNVIHGLKQWAIRGAGIMAITQGRKRHAS
jgi:hypothetical protein